MIGDFRLTARKLFLSFISILFLLILIELLIRFIPRTFINYNLGRYAVSEKDVDFMNRNFRESGRYFYRPALIPGLGYELIPGVSTMHARVNSLGLVGKEREIKKRKNTYRILLLGDSIIQEGFFAEYLEKLLDDLYPQWNFEVWNAGVGGYQINQYAVYLKHKGIKYNPDIVIVNLGLNDFSINNVVYYLTKDGVIAYHNFANQLSKVIPLNKWLFRHSYLYRLLISKTETICLVSNTVKGADNSQREGEYYLESIRNICQKNNSALLFTVFPYLKPLIEYEDFEKKAYENIVDACQGLGIEYIDLHNFFPNKDRSGLRFFKNDYVHFSPMGMEIAAKVVFNYLIGNHLNGKINNAEKPKKISEY